MVQNPQETLREAMTGDEVVISGMSGEFPKSENVMQLMENLYNKVDMVQEVDCSTVRHPSLPKHYGKIKNLDKFDAQFFRVTPLQAASLDPLSRKTMENAFCAMYDSGINPLSLSGTKLGVFIGSSSSDSMVMNLYDRTSRNPFVVSGSSKTMMANRVSYWIDAKGPSYTVDQACSSAMACLELAYNSMKRGDCDAALVGGCSTCVHPALSLNLKIAGHLCMDGKTKSFDKNGNGYVRAEAVSVLFLQKAKDAKRIYTEIYHIKGKYFTRPDSNFLPMRHSEDVKQFLEEFYTKAKVCPSEIEYVEAFGSGIAEADGKELDAIGIFFPKSRPVKVGSIKSNLGNTEAANGPCSLTKLCLAYQKGLLPANLHYNELQTQFPAVNDGRIHVVTENTPFGGGWTALNSMSFTGCNYHVLLKGHQKKKDHNRYKSSIPRLVLLSGRDERCVNKIIDELKSKPIDVEQIALLHNIYKLNFPGHTGRGYTILDTNENNVTISLARSFEIYPGTTRPVCFLYSGMGSQWNCMGTELLRIPIFAAAIERCRRVLDPLGVDIVNILTNPDQSVFDSILNSMVGITAIQIGLTDILRAIGLIPDNIIGHSIGELGCAYADGCFTAEETILASYNRGLVSIETPFIRGSMAAIGLRYSEVLPMCPPEIEVACHNSAGSSTLSGPADIMNEFVSDLSKRGIFASEVACSNIAYHSKYVADAGPALLSSMKSLVPNPKLRSEKWISTSVSQEKWDKNEAKYASSEYFTNNLLGPVLFEENSSLIPKDAIMIEIAPHGLLQAIVKKSHSECVNVSLTKRADQDPVSFLLQSIGKLYEAGLNPSIDVLYPDVEFPVSTETPLLSHLVEWDHSVDWPQIVYVNKKVKETAARDFVISTFDDEHQFIKGFVRNGINEVPETAILVFIWQTLAMYSGKYYTDMSVTFYDVIFHCQLQIDEKDLLRLRIAVQNVSNRFEVFTGNTHIMSGFIDSSANVENMKLDKDTSDNDILISGKDFYTLLHMKGYSYGHEFKKVHSLNTTSGTAYIKWTGEWAIFLDSLLQLNMFVRDHDGISTPKMIKKLSINVDGHKNYTTILLNNVNCYKAEIAEKNTIVRCGGIELDGVIFSDITKLNKQPDVLLCQEFVPHELEKSVNIETATFINLQLVADNMTNNNIKVLELLNSCSNSLSNTIKKISVKFPSHYFDVNCTEVSNNIKIQDVIDVNLFVVHNFFENKKIQNIVKQILTEDVFILTFERNITDINNTFFKVITSMPVDGGLLALLKKRGDNDSENVIYLHIDDNSTFLWVPRVLTALKQTSRVVLVAERQPYCGLFEFVNNLKNKRNNIGVVVVDDYHAPLFDPKEPIYAKQLQKNLTFNLMKNGQWGSYYFIMNPKPNKIQNLTLTITTIGHLDNLTWMDTPKNNENFVEISYAGLSARDCEKALGKTANHNLTFGMDFSGVDCKGNQVMGLVANGAVSSTVVADPTLLWPVPKHWSLQDAATVPLPYIHAYYILAMKGGIRRKQNIFVTGGAGALGQAIISICHSLDCTVFTTVSEEKKKIFLMKLFPKLKDENIFYSRHDSFFTKVKEVTKNKRCKIVINCSSGVLREAAMKCVGFLGKFIDVHNEDYYLENKKLGMFYLLEGRNYKVVDLSSLFTPENISDRKALQILMTEGIANGTVRPLTRVVYSPLEMSRAFKLVSSSRHRGRALIKMSDAKSLSTDVDVIQRKTFSNGVHIVICDNSDLAVEVIDHLIRTEAKNIVINLKKTYQTSYLVAKTASWKKFEVNIELNSDDLKTKDGCERLLKAGQKLGPIASIFIVQDYKEEVGEINTAPEAFQSSYNDTILVTANLDMVSRKMCRDLSNFVVISVTSQNLSTDYATSSCQRICEARSKVGLPALVLQTRISNKIDENNSSFLSKLDISTLSSVFNAMDSSLKLKYNNVTVFNFPHISEISMAENLGRIFGVKQIDEMDENLTLKDINANDMIINEIKSRLSPVTYSTDDLLDMTIACIKNLCYKAAEKKKANYNVGLGAFYSHVEKNEYVAIDAVVPMKTLQLSFEESEYIDRSDNHLVIIPGFDGRHQVFESIAERLKIRAATLQLGPDLICDSIPEMAQTLANHIKSHLKISEKFYILGYSFGVNVALEIAKLLEAEGHKGVVYCLDSSPEALKSQLKAYIGDISEAELQNAVLVHMFQLMTENKGIEINEELQKANNWADKIEICLMKLQGLVHFSLEHRRTILESAYKRIMFAKTYEPDFKLESEVVLMKATPHPRMVDLEDDYGLSKFTKEPVKVFDIEADHATAPYDCRVSNIVNKMLDLDMLEEFKRKNLCEYYYL